MQSADRTRSKRWRSGTRRNKKTAPVVLCENPTWCLVHATVTQPKRPPAMAMIMTKCEQKWMDDVRASRPHVHIKLRRSIVRRSNSFALLTVQRRIYANSPGGVVAGMDMGHRDHQHLTMMGVGRRREAAAMEDEVQRQQAMGYDVVQYGPMQTGRSR